MDGEKRMDGDKRMDGNYFTGDAPMGRIFPNGLTVGHTSAMNTYLHEGMKVVAIVVGEDHEERAKAFVRAVAVSAEPEAKDSARAVLQPPADMSISLWYKNHRGETRLRTLHPLRLYFGATQWHPEPQWLLKAMDVERGEVRDFALVGFAPGADPDFAEVEPANAQASKPTDQPASDADTLFDIAKMVFDEMPEGGVTNLAHATVVAARIMQRCGFTRTAPLPPPDWPTHFASGRLARAFLHPMPGPKKG